MFDCSDNGANITSVSLTNLFPDDTIDTVEELNLSANQPYTHVRGVPTAAKDYTFTLTPMEIRTFAVTLKGRKFKDVSKLYT